MSIEQIIKECQKCLADEEVEELVELISNLLCPLNPEGIDEGKGILDGF